MVRTISGTDTFQDPDLRGPRFVIIYQSTKEQPMSNTPDKAYLQNDARMLREILVVRLTRFWGGLKRGS